MPAKRASRLQTPARAERPNHVWTIDFKGWWYTRNRTRFEPLTIRDDCMALGICFTSFMSMQAWTSALSRVVGSS